jgi:L-alanine-DL-glutamate epimerase-like enolase superfamily enzyme
MARAVDILQPNAAISGGFTQCVKIAALADSFNISVDNGGAWPFANMHLQAGVSNGGLVEYHASSVDACRQIYNDPPVVKDGFITLPEAPGLGYELNLDALPKLEF